MNVVSSIQSKSIFSSFFMKLGILIVLIFFAQIVVAAIQKQSLEPIVKGIGNQFLSATNTLSNQANQIIKDEGIKYDKISNLSSFFAVVKTLLVFFESIFIILFWLKLLYLFVGIMPFSSRDHVFKNIIFAILIFLFFQSILIFSTAAVNKEVACFSGCEQSVTYYILKPITAFVDFFKSIPYLLKPINNISEYINNDLNATIKNVTQKVV